MDPIGFGIVFAGATGVTLFTLTLLGKKISINESAMKFVMEASKYGMIFYLLHYLSKLFL